MYCELLNQKPEPKQTLADLGPGKVAVLRQPISSWHVGDVVFYIDTGHLTINLIWNPRKDTYFMANSPTCETIECRILEAGEQVKITI